MGTGTICKLGFAAELSNNHKGLIFVLDVGVVAVVILC